MIENAVENILTQVIRNNGRINRLLQHYQNIHVSMSW